MEQAQALVNHHKPINILPTRYEQENMKYYERIIGKIETWIHSILRINVQLQMTPKIKIKYIIKHSQITCEGYQLVVYTN